MFEFGDVRKVCLLDNTTGCLLYFSLSLLSCQLPGATSSSSTLSTSEKSSFSSTAWGGCVCVCVCVWGGGGGGGGGSDV